MTQDEVIRMAREAGAKPSHNPEEWDIFKIRDTDLERFAALVAAHEREECAKWADLVAREIDNTMPIPCYVNLEKAMSKPVAYRFKSPLSEEGRWEYGKEPPVGSRWEIEGLYRVQVNVPRTPLEKAAKEMLQSVECMIRNGEWYQAQERADALRDALSQPERAPPQRPWVGLTDEEIDHAAEQSDNYSSFIAGAFFAQDKLEGKNGG